MMRTNASISCQGLLGETLSLASLMRERQARPPRFSRSSYQDRSSMIRPLRVHQCSTPPLSSGRTRRSAQWSWSRTPGRLTVLGVIVWILSMGLPLLCVIHCAIAAGEPVHPQHRTMHAGHVVGHAPEGCALHTHAPSEDTPLPQAFYPAVMANVSFPGHGLVSLSSILHLRLPPRWWLRAPPTPPPRRASERPWLS
jgi:hypothetical protein